MKQTAIALITLVVTTLAHAEEFTLTDSETGQRFGPFVYTNDALVTVEDRTLHLTRVTTKATEIEDRMRSIMIPSIEFRQANIFDILQLLSQASVGGIEQPSVSIIPLGLCINDQGRPVTNMPPAEFFSDGFSEVQDVPDDGVPKVTLNVRRISLYDALSVVCEIAGLEFRVDDRGVVFVTPGGKEIRPEEIKDQPAGGAYVSPAAGDPSAHP